MASRALGLWALGVNDVGSNLMIFAVIPCGLFAVLSLSLSLYTRISWTESPTLKLLDHWITGCLSGPAQSSPAVS